jgi:voltage-dependent calcium channel P/Q type alpha-1A
VFALLGMSMFAGKVKFDEDDQVDIENGVSPRENYDKLHWAVITIFEVLMGEAWNEIMYQGIRAQGWLVAIYYIILFMLGAIIMLNLFLAILLGNFDKARNFGQKK